MKDRQAPLEDVRIPAIRSVIDPIRDRLAPMLAPVAEDGDLTVVFVVEDDRSLAIRLRGTPFIVNRARDILGTDRAIGPLLA